MIQSPTIINPYFMRYIMKFALFENTFDTNGLSCMFINYIDDICIYNISELDIVYNKIENYQRAGYYALGYIAYDAIKTPLLHFVIFQNLIQCHHQQLIDTLKKHGLITDCQINDNLNIPFLESELDYRTYETMFQQVTNNLQQGNSYQINLTKRYNLDLSNLDSFAIYYRLARDNPVRYTAYLPFSNETIISISPELFFHKINSTLITKPMKGTMPRSSDLEQDKLNREFLMTDEKNRAENLIIVDLLRNDLAKIAKTNSVTVDKLFAIEEYATVFQMTSQISACIDNNIRLATIINALFPCGSITGAPKKKTMELIQEIEQSPRGIYTGAIGYLLPNNDMLFNVAIRTLYQNHHKLATIGVGGGITINSDVLSEWQEMNAKLRFISNYYQPDFNLIESFLIQNRQIINMEQHLERLTIAAEKLHFKCDILAIREKLYNLVTSGITGDINQLFKLRLELTVSGDVTLEYLPISNNHKVLKVALLNQAIDTSHPLFRYKTTSPIVRGLYTQLDSQFKPDGIDELLFINHRGEITEGRFYNIIIELNEQMITPPLSCGLLNGIFRAKMIEQQQVCEQIITKEMLAQAKRIYLCNDVRGLIECQLMGEIN